MVLSLIPLFCGACDQPVDSTKQEHLKNLEQQITELKNKVDKLNGETTRLRFELDAEKDRYRPKVSIVRLIKIAPFIPFTHQRRPGRQERSRGRVQFP